MNKLVCILCVAAAAIAFTLLSGCGDTIVIDITAEPTSAELIAYINDHYEVTQPIIVQIIEITDPSLVEATCHARHVGGCNKQNMIIVRGDVAPEEKCQIILHELNHSAAYRLRGDWDLNHTFNPEFYNKTLFETCKKIADKGKDD